MRVRLKCNGCTSKLEVAGSSCTWQELKEAVCASLFPQDPSSALDELQLSFNNKDLIQGDDGADVKALGIANGDLLWVLRPQRAPAPPPSVPEPKRAKEVPAAQQAVQDAAGPSAPAAAAAAPSLVGNDPGQAAANGVAPMDVAGPEAGGETAGSDEEVPAALAVPSYLLRSLSLAPFPGAASAFQPTTPAHVLLLAAHACMLEAGFEPSWVPQQGTAAAPPLGGGLGVESPSGGWGPYSLPPWVQTSATVFRLAYRLPVLQQVQPEEAAAGTKAAPTPAAGSGEQPPACTLQCSTLGAGMAVLVASTPKGHAHHLSLVASSFFQEAHADASSTAQAAAAGASGGEGGAAGEGPSTCGWDGQQLWVVGGRWCADAAAVWRLWRALKDGLTFPMLLAAYSDAGLPPPAGLLALPEELKLAILAELNAMQLVALGSACTELRHLASQDSLWKPLFDAEFPAASSFYTSQAQRRGYKWAFGACWRDRKQREEAVRRQRRFMPAIPHMGPRPPFYPAPAPFGIPGITGGDYDRLPQPFFGGGPGMYGGGSGGMGGLGTSMFGGRRSGGRGGGGGFRLH